MEEIDQEPGKEQMQGWRTWFENKKPRVECFLKSLKDRSAGFVRGNTDQYVPATNKLTANLEQVSKRRAFHKKKNTPRSPGWPKPARTLGQQKIRRCRLAE